MLNEKLSTDEIEKLFIENDNDNSCLRNFCLDLSSGIVNANWTILEIVESLKDLLTNSDLRRHNYGLLILGNVVEFLPTDFLREKEVEFITQFFCGQIKQHHSFITAALKGLVTLVKNPQLPKHSLHDVTSTLFNNVVWQTQPLTDRRAFYVILQYIVFNRLEDYKSTCSELLFNIISSVDGERDPRNLLLLFSFLPKLYTSIPLGALTEDAFEVVSCYFPIDFHSTAESGSVTREDLVSALNPCLLAHPDFAALCIPLIQEKLESSLKSAKIDSYNLLTEAAQVWPPHMIAPHLDALWQAVKSDVLPPREAQTAETAVRALQAVTRTTEEPYLSSLLTSIMSSCEVYLSDVQLSLFEPSFRLLLSLMQTTLTGCSIISKTLLPKLISLLKVTQESSRNLMLDKLTTFIDTCLQMSPEFDLGGDVWREVVACTDTSPQAYIALTPGVACVDLESRLKLYRNIVAHLTASCSQVFRSACMKCLQALATVYEDEVEEHVLKNVSIQVGDKDLTRIRIAFETVCSLAIVDKFHPSVDKLFGYLVSEGGPSLSLAISGLRSLVETEDNKYDRKNLFVFLYSQSSVIATLLGLHIDADDLINAATVVRILVASQGPSEQIRCVPPHVKGLLQHCRQTHKVVFLEALVGPLWPEVSVLTLEEIRSHIIPVSLDSSVDQVTRTSALQLLASIINKSSDDSTLELVSQSMSTCTEDVELCSTICAYVTKALVLRSHPHMEVWIGKLLVLLDSAVEEVALAAAEGFHLIVQESASSLSRENHCVVRLLYRQHLFHVVLPRLVLSAGKVQHLKALAYLLQAVPHTVYMAHIKEIIPLLVKSLDLDSETLLLTVLNTLTHLLSANDSFLQDHVDTFIPRFLHLARHNLFMQVRIAALKCLCSSLRFSPISLLPHKQQVIAELVHCLDDKKRLVRREAARTRSKWYLLGAPTPD